MRGHVLFLCLLAITLQTASARSQDTAAPEPDSVRTWAKAAFEEGRVLFNEEQYLEAAMAFRRAYDISPTWRLLFNIAQAETAAKRYGLAIEAFEKYLAEAGDDIAQNRSEEVMAEIKRLRMLVGTVAVVGEDDATLFVDDVQRGQVPLSGPVRVAIGTHTVRIERDGQVLLAREITVAGQMTTQVTVRTTGPDGESIDAPADEVTMTPQTDTTSADTNEAQDAYVPPMHRVSKPSKGLLVGGIVSSVLGVAGVTLGGIYAKKFSDDNDDWETYRGKYKDSKLATDYDKAMASHDRATTDAAVLKVGFIAGGACLAAGTVLMIVYATRAKKSRLSWTPATGLGVTF